jgi:hypothetical protein
MLILKHNCGGCNFISCIDFNFWSEHYNASHVFLTFYLGFV